MKFMNCHRFDREKCWRGQEEKARSHGAIWSVQGAKYDCFTLRQLANLNLQLLPHSLIKLQKNHYNIARALVLPNSY